MEHWRLILSNNTDGAWNMALDEAILEAVGTQLAPPTLRLYAWTPPTLSLGHAQPVSDVDLPALNALGWGLVRRPTGGRAILHTDELTYSICTAADHPVMAGGVLESYRRLSAGLQKALELLGLDTQAEKAYTNTLPPGGPVCFEVPSNYEITVGGKKIIGSAQARKYNGVLQHGSLPLTGDLTRITRVLQFENESARQQASDRLLEHATTTETVLGAVLTWQQAAQAFADAFSQTLSIIWDEAPPSTAELERAKELTLQKYSHPDWTFRH